MQVWGKQLRHLLCSNLTACPRGWLDLWNEKNHSSFNCNKNVHSGETSSIKKMKSRVQCCITWMQEQMNRFFNHELTSKKSSWQKVRFRSGVQALEMLLKFLSLKNIRFGVAPERITGQRQKEEQAEEGKNKSKGEMEMEIEVLSACYVLRWQNGSIVCGWMNFLFKLKLLFKKERKNRKKKKKCALGGFIKQH